MSNKKICLFSASLNNSNPTQYSIKQGYQTIVCRKVTFPFLVKQIFVPLYVNLVYYNKNMTKTKQAQSRLQHKFIQTGIALSLPFLLACTYPKAKPSTDSETSGLHICPPEVPEYAVFANDTICLQRYDLRERMDRELLAFSYMHSNSVLMLKRANRYFPIVEPILRRNGIPDDFKYLMAIESSLNPSARSNAGAAGLWQFMPQTGREFGLEVNPNIDERFHIEKSTEAACRYLKQAFEKYGNWMSVCASYNAGQGRISTQLEKQSVKQALDLWLNEETSRYMFRVLAAKSFFSNPQKFGFRLTASQLYPPLTYHTDTLSCPIEDLYEYARKKGISYAQLKDANLWLRENKLNNQSHRTYVVKIPDKQSLYYNPDSIKPHDPNWVIG